MSLDPREERPGSTARRLAEFVLTRPPALGSTRLTCVDGPAGSGKTTLAASLCDELTRRGTTRLLHMDDMYEGWDGLADVSARIAEALIEPLQEGRPGGYRRYDWHRQRFAERHSVEPVDVLLLEGVGSGARCYDPCISALIWVEAPDDLRLARGVERDGQAMLPQLRAWMEDEAALFARDQTRARADVLVDGSRDDDNLLFR